MAKGTIIAIETSFDDAAIAAIDADGRILAGFTAGQIELHKLWGGVVPEIAARTHLTDLPQLYIKLREYIDESDISAVAVTRGPGLIGSLLIGVNFARGLALGYSVPCVGLNHLEGHLVSPFLVDDPSFAAAGESGVYTAPATDFKPNSRRIGSRIEDIPFPHLALIVSGGNTLLVRVGALGDYEVLGETLDDAGGELLDKIAVALGRSYPGGATIEKLAAEAEPQTGDEDSKAWLAENRLPVPMRQSGDANFSYSGLKTAALRVIEREGLHIGHHRERLFCFELQRVLVESLFIKVRAVLESDTGWDTRTCTLSGGVAANETLVTLFRERLQKMNVQVLSPSKSLAVDNAEMMAYLAWLYAGSDGEWLEKSPDFDAEAGLRL